NEPLTIQVGRKARHTDAIGAYLRATPGGADLADTLAKAAPEIVDRCLSAPGPFADRSTTQVWAERLVGLIACDALLLAATREAHRRSPGDRLGRALSWAEERFASSLRRARDGRPEDLLIPSADEVHALVGDYEGAIGDVEQTLAGEEEELD